MSGSPRCPPAHVAEDGLDGRERPHWSIEIALESLD
jgi:hypothetical protein